MWLALTSGTSRASASIFPALTPTSSAPTRPGGLRAATQPSRRSSSRSRGRTGGPRGCCKPRGCTPWVLPGSVLEHKQRDVIVAEAALVALGGDPGGEGVLRRRRLEKPVEVLPGPAVRLGL